MEILQISDDIEKKNIARFILEALPDWFGIPESRDEYIEGSIGKIFFCAYKDENPIGFLYLKQTGKDTVELAVMGVLKEYHRNGIGKSLFGMCQTSKHRTRIFVYSSKDRSAG